MPTRQQVADQLNKLNSQGATENQILDYVASAGYVPDDFNADLNGSFRPMVVGTGTSTTNYTAAEAKESQQYFENLAASSSTVTPKPTASTTSASTTTKTVTTTEVTNFQQTTGGGTTTVTSTPAKDTAASLNYKAEADQAFSLQSAYALNPNSTFGQKALDRRLADGRLTQEQYNEIKNSTPEDRRAKALEYNAQYDTARTKEIAAQGGGQPVVVTTPSENSSSITVDYQKSTSTSSTTLNGAVGGTSITTETVEGTTYQVVNNADGTKSYTPANAADLAAAQATSVTIADNNPAPKEIINPNSDPNTNIGAEIQTPEPQQTISLASDPNTNIGEEGQDFVFEPLQEPPITNDGDEFSGIDEQVQRQKDLEDGSLEFAGIDEQIALNETTLQEPPLLSDEEVDQQLRLAAQDETIAEQKVVDEFDGIDAQVAANKAEADLDAQDAAIGGGSGVGYKGLQGATDEARAQQITQDAENAKTQGDWRVRLSLAPSAGYLYKAVNPGILLPLQKTDGVIFPYTPSIQVTYAAHYDPSDLTHSNYKIFQYKNSSVDQVSITCDFTAQDTEEANYMLAVIHFFRSVTKMFYGQDQIPKPGTPPPLCYLSGMGDFQFDRHPLAISSFNYSLPTDVDYIRASSPTLLSGVNSTGYNDNRNSDLTPQQVRMQSGTTPLNAGATETAPKFGKATNTQPTYVPTKIQIAIVAYPIVTRNDISNNFSLAEYATGKLLQGSKRKGGGIW
jgi:hypothetical protein